MEIKILQVFYDKNGLPYKDKERTVHYPITSGTFLGASNTTQIRFYYDQLDELNESTFVAVSKLPNGKIGSEILESAFDEELNENYVTLSLSQFYTQYKGDVFISLQGYQGGVRVEQDENGIYSIIGTPTIQATGSIKLSIAYAPTFIGSGQTESITLQRVLAELSTKLGIRQETLHVEELPTVGNPNVWYVVNDDPNDTTKANIYIWNATTQTYVWVGDNILDLGDYYTKEQGEDFENDVNEQLENMTETIAGLGQLTPSGVDTSTNILSFNENKGIYVGSDTGDWYYWDGTQYVSGGQYVAEPNDATLNYLKENDNEIAKNNHFEIMQFIQQFEQGTINGQTGANEESEYRIRTTNYIDLSKFPSFTKWLIFSCNSGYKINAVYCYKYENASYTFLGELNVSSNGSILLEEGTTYIKFTIAKVNNTTILPNEYKNAFIKLQLSEHTEERVDRTDNSLKKYAFENELDLLLGVEFENGTIADTGEPGYFAPNRLRPINFISTQGSKTIKVELENGYSLFLEEYGYNELTEVYSFLGEKNISLSQTVILNDNTKAIKPVLKKNDNSSLTPKEINNLHIYISLDKDYNLFNSSLTNNLLDLSSVITSVRITDDAPYFVENDNGAKISLPIPIKGIRQIHLHNNFTTANAKWCAFTIDTSLTESSVVSVVSGLGAINNDVTLEVPSGANYLYVTLGFGSDDYSSTTVSAGVYPTDESYEKGNPDFIEIGKNTIDLKKANYLDWYRYENQRVYKEIIQNSTNTNNNARYEKAKILFFTDSHIDILKEDANLQNAMMTFDFANNSPIGFDAIINGGDTITPFGRNAKAKEKENFARFFNKAKQSQYPVIYCKGNHDLNDWDNTPANTFDDSDWSSMFFDFAESKWGIIRQTKSNTEKSTWHYYDIEDKKIRVICIDVQDTDKTRTNQSGNVFYYGGVSWYISQEQFDWIVGTALNFDSKEDKDWGVIIVTHQSKIYSDWTGEEPGYQNAISKLLEVLVAFNSQTTYSSSFTYDVDHFFDLTISANFTRYANLPKKPKIICWLIGHEHYDKYENQSGINVIWTTCGECYDDEEPNYPRIRNSVNQNSFDILIIDTKQKKIKIIRYGAGENRFTDEELSY